MEEPLDKYPCMWCGDMVDHGKHDCGDDGQSTSTDHPEDITGLAHELWALAQLMPEEGILDGVMRIEEALQGKIKGTKDPLLEEMARALDVCIKSIECSATCYQNSLWNANYKANRVLQKYNEQRGSDAKQRRDSKTVEHHLAILREVGC
jgi:hypothetical protein